MRTKINSKVLMLPDRKLNLKKSMGPMNRKLKKNKSIFWRMVSQMIEQKMKHRGLCKSKKPNPKGFCNSKKPKKKKRKGFCNSKKRKKKKRKGFCNSKKRKKKKQKDFCKRKEPNKKKKENSSFWKKKERILSKILFLMIL